nr:hypothetical protein Itr_chr01CG13130 [Ipomoea trifida]
MVRGKPFWMTPVRILAQETDGGDGRNDRVRSKNGARRNRSKSDPEAATWLAARSARLSVRGTLSPAERPRHAQPG